jgi:hypothetical protein
VRVIAEGSEPLTYHWAKLGPAGFGHVGLDSPLFPTQVQLPLGTADAGDEGIYRVEVSNQLGRVFSEEVVVGINGIGQSQQDPEVPGFWLQLELEPAGVGGGWRFEGESRWRVSGEPVQGLTAGRRTVVFKPVPGMIRPPDEVMVIEATSPGVLTRTYLPGDPAEDTGSVTCRIEPAALADPALPVVERAQWRLAGEDDAQWSDSGAIRTGLPAGDYLIECKAVPGRETPNPVRVTVDSGETVEGTVVYPPPGALAAGTWNLLDFATIHSAAGPTPYACVGRLSSDQSEGTGFLVAASVVLTDARLVFDEGTLSFSTRPQWAAERHRGIHEPVGVPVDNVLLMAGYSARRLAEGTPGELDPESANLGVAALRLDQPSPRFTGYLASDDAPHAWLGSTAAKRAVGYPSRLGDASLRGRMHESAVSAVPLGRIAGGVYAAEPFEGGLGLAGAPLFVRHSDGRDYPAGIFIGGGTGPTVRAIDSEILRLVLLAAAAPVGSNSSINISVSGGVTMTSWLRGSSQDPAALQVDLVNVPAGSIGRWKIGPTGTLRRSGDLVNGITAGTWRVFFPPIAGWLPPGEDDPASPGGGYVDVPISGGRKHVITASYSQFAIAPPNRTATAGTSALFSLEPLRMVTAVEWYRNGELLQGQSGSSLLLFPLTSAMAGSYTARVAYQDVVYWTPPAVLTVLPAAQSVQWIGPLAITLEALPIDLEATADSGLPVEFEVLSGPATLAGNRLTPSGPGTVVVRALQPGNDDFMAAAPVSKTLEFVVTTPAAWRFVNFGTMDNTGPAADDADPDGDGQHNLAEFTAGSGPNDARDFFRVLTSERTAAGFTVTAAGKAGRSYVLERRDGGHGTWADAAASGPLAADGTVTLTDPAPPPSSGMYRVKVMAP